MGSSRVVYSEEGVGLVKTKRLQSSAKYSTREGSPNGKDCCGCGNDLRVEGGL